MANQTLKRLRVERGLYKRGDSYLACATPTGESKAAWKSLGKVNLSMARRLREEWVAEVRQGKVVRSKLKFREVAQKWIDEQERLVGLGELRQSTYDGYESALRLHVLPFFENRVIQTIEPEDLVTWQQALKAQGIGPGYIANLWKPLRQVLGYAVRKSYLTTNPADALTKRERPKPGPKRIRCLGAEEIGLLVSNAVERYRLAIEMAIFLGVRLGELRAIRWRDVDFAEGMIRITGQCDRNGERLDHGKTEAAHREVVLMDGLTKRLKAHKLASPFSQPDDFVVASEVGTAFQPRNLAQRGLGKAAENAGLTGVSFHTLRHTFASILIAQGHDAVYVAAQMGHERPSITLDTYSHLFDRARQADAHRAGLDSAFGHLFDAAT